MKIHPRRSLVFSLALAAACLLATPARADETDDLFERGNAAYDAGKYDEALVHFNAVWKVRKTYDLAGTMAQAEIKLGKLPEAATHLAYALAHFPLTAKPDMKNKLEEVLADLKSKVATIRIQVNVKDAAIAVDGAAIDAASMGSDVFVAPGSRVIEASAPGYQPVRRTIDAKPGTAHDVALTLIAAEPPGRSMLGPALAFGAGGAGLVLGAIAGGVAAAKTSDLKKVCGDALACPPSERGNLDGATTAAHLSTVGFVLAGVGAAAGVTLLLVPIGQKPKAQAGLVVGPAFVGVKGAF